MIYKFGDINESKKEKKYNNILRNLNVMDAYGNINLTDMTDKIDKFLSNKDNKNDFLKDYKKDVKPHVGVKNKEVRVKDLKPSQTEIFLDHILTRLAENKKERKQILKGDFRDDDILISSDGHIIDGHHRWALALLLNPNCELKCTEIDIPIKYALPMLNAIMEVTEKSDNDEIDEYELDIFKVRDWDKEKLLMTMNSIIEKYKNPDKLYKKIKKKLNLRDHPLEHIRRNLKKLNKPTGSFSEREDMPQLKEKDAKKLL